MVDETRAEAPPVPAWKRCLDFDRQDADHYLDNYNQTLLDMAGAARRVLELGCAGGRFGLELKARHPGATVVGIEAGRSAAEKAATRLDRVIHARIEDVDFAAEGLRPGEFDLVVAADILEHLVNPWSVLERVRAVIAPDGVMLVSIPNARNLTLIADLADKGRWEYRDRGLLDVTHLRFFTLVEFVRMLNETGFRPEEVSYNIMASLADFYRQHAAGEKVNVKVGRFMLAGLDKREFTELCTEQFFLKVRPA